MLVWRGRRRVLILALGVRRRLVSWCRPAAHTTRGSHHRGDSVGNAEQRPAVNLSVDAGVGDSMPAGNFTVTPDPLQRVGFGEAGCAVSDDQLTDRVKIGRAHV